MGAEALKDEEGKEHYIFDQEEFYDDGKMGDKLEDFEILEIHTDESIKTIQSMKNQKIYAMKSIAIANIKKSKPNKFETFKNQIENYINLNYFHVLKVFKYLTDEKYVHIIVEHTNNGSLADFIKLNSTLKEFIPEESLLNIFLQCIKALRYLHSKKIIHKCISPKHILMTNEKRIKLELCPVIDDDSKELKYPPEKVHSEKGDIYSLGCIFFQLCFLDRNLTRDKEDKFACLKDPKLDTGYSKELLNILIMMLEEDPNKRISTEDLYSKIKEVYDKKITKNSSISSLISCFYSINRLAREFIKNQSKFQDKELTPISSSFLDCFNSIEDNNRWVESIKNLRRYIGTKNPKLDGDKEVNLLFLILFLVESMHKELNKKPKTEVDLDQKYLIKRKEDKTNKADMIINFFRYFKEHFNSIISETFFGIMKNKNICKECGLKTYSFKCFCMLYFDIDKLVPNGENKKLKLEDFFKGLKEGKFYSNFKNEYFCKGCSKLTVHELQKSIYYMPNSLIICFISKNGNSNVEIEYPDFINLESEREYNLSPSNFNLQGFINKVGEKGKEEKYVSFYKSPIDGDIFSCDKIINEEDGWDKNKGNTVMLFYESV
jgi:NIMA (never in mitosis gene a)-related kinase